ncbi:MAG: 3-deoxy-D-manno-octulosonate 8-phosphate phosphatase [Ginsengibacter sp.]
MNILSRFRLVKTFVFDMDGVLTDGSLHMDHENRWLRKMNIKDGYALQLAIKNGYRIVVVSGSDAPPVSERLHKLGIGDVFMKVTDKAGVLKNYLSLNGLSAAETLYMGDDIPDYQCMGMVGFACCPGDAAVEIKKISLYISPIKGGCGCVRDVIEKVLKLNNNWPFHTDVPST